MSVVSFSKLPEWARVWIHASEERLTEEQVQALDLHMSRFLSDWRSHGRPIAPSWQLAYDRFVITGVDEAAMSLSGCSIDSMFRSLEAFADQAGIRFSTGGGQVFYRDSSREIRCVERTAFAELARRNAVDEDTIVFDNTISTFGQFCSGLWETPMRHSWHGQVFLKSRA